MTSKDKLRQIKDDIEKHKNLSNITDDEILWMLNRVQILTEALVDIFNLNDLKTLNLTERAIRVLLEG